MRNRHIRLAVLAALSSAAALTSVSGFAGDIATDGTLPGTTASTLNAVNGSYAITQNLGFRNGTNLFHSFDVFNLDQGETAVFSGNAAITNIISRVTGGIPTSIDGTIRSTINGANFWFVNPAGITVGPSGAIDVSGAVALGAADSIDFGDGQQFFALPGDDDTAVSLLVSSPVDFGFLPDSFSGELTIQSEQLLTRTTLVAENRQIQPLDSNPNLERFSLLLTGGAGVSMQSEGDINLVDARVRTNGFFAGPIDMTALGSINLSGSDVRTSAGLDGGGAIFIQAGELVTISRSALVAESIGNDVPTGDITVMGSGVLINDQSLLATQFQSSGGGIDDIGAGKVSVVATGVSTETAPQLQLSSATDGVIRIVDSTIKATNVGGRPLFETEAVSIGSGGIFNDTGFDPDDPDAPQLPGATHIVIANSEINTDASDGGIAGSIGIGADATLWISDSTLSARGDETAGGAGVISAFANTTTLENTLIDARNAAPSNLDLFSDTGIFLGALDLTVNNSTLRTDANNGAASGQIDLSGDTVTLTNSTLDTSVSTQDPSAALFFNESPGTIRLSAGSEDDIDFESGAFGSRGVTLRIANSTLRANSDNNGNPDTDVVGGDAGRIELNAFDGTVQVTGSTLQSAATGINGGASGLVRFTAHSVDVADSSISVATESLNPEADFGGGNGGDARSIDFQAIDAVKLTNTTLTSTTSGVATAGSLVVFANSLDIKGSTLQASTTGTGGAGSVVFFLGNVFGGDFDPDDPDAPAPTIGPAFLRITDSSLISSTGDTPAAAGSIIGFVGGAIDLNNATLNVSATSRPDLDGGSADNLAGNGEISLFANFNPISIINSTLQANTSGIVDGGSIDLEGSTFTIRGSNITASSSAPATAPDPNFPPVDPRASAGSIFIGVPLDVEFPGVPDAPEPPAGPFTIESSTIATSAAATNGGDITIFGSNSAFTLTNSQITASAGGTGQGGDITVSGISQATVRGSQIQALAESGAGGVIGLFLQPDDPDIPDDVAATGPLIIENSTIAANATNADGGDILLGAEDQQLVVRGSNIVASAGGTGLGGDILLDGSGVLLENNQIQALASAGNGGLIDIQLATTGTGTLQINNSQIATNAAASNGGDISFDASGRAVSIKGSNIVASAGGSGSGGDIAIANAATANIQDTQIQALANAGSGGTISVALLASDAGPASIVNSTITTNAMNASGGSITFDAAGHQVMVQGSSVVASAGGAGVGGDITFTNVAGATVADSQFQALANAGAGGTISFTLSSNQSPLQIDNTSITTNAVAANGGNIFIDAAGSQLLMRGSSIVASAGGSGRGGDISILNAGGATLQDSQIQALANAGAGGTISLVLTNDVTAPLVLLSSSITTNAVAAGGGNITLDAGGNSLLMRDSTVLASAGAAGTGGNVLIDNVGRTIVQRSQILARADAGNGGTITINLNQGALFVRDAQSTISADSNSGNDGAIDINSPDTDLNPAVKPQDATISNPPELSANACAAVAEGARSTFVRENRGGVRASPDGYLASFDTGAAATQKTAAVTSAEGVRVAMADAVTASCR